MSMTLEQAIEHAEDVSISAIGCECRDEHRQLAEWLRELVERRKKDIIDMPSALNNQVNLCDSCTYTYPECPSEKDDVIFGNGIGNDNICACNKYQPTVQPVATDTNVGDIISRRAAIDALQKCRKHCIDPFDSYHIDIQDAEYQLSKLPTIQPEGRSRRERKP